MSEVFVDRDLEDIIPVFIENRFKDIKELKLLLVNKDIEKIQFLGHSLKGVGSGYGFHEVTNFGRDIEQMAKDKDLTKVLGLIEQLDHYMNHVNITFVDED